jgi:predicted  nucleic acid-binding Zn-ribbon protein
MSHQLFYLSELSKIDLELDELEEDFGDLPEQVRKLEDLVADKKAIVEDTTRILKELREFKTNSKITLADYKEREAELTKKQFKVKNNKEFDAITKEIDYIRKEYNKLTDELRNVNVKEENLIKLLDEQKLSVKEAESELQEKQMELDIISSDQNEVLKDLRLQREQLISKIDPSLFEKYKRVRHFHKDAVVKIKKNSCSGCYSAVPPQKIVEMRGDLDLIYTCENCGRIMYPEELTED